MCNVHKLAAVLVIIGAINWGLIGINSQWNVVHQLLGSWSMAERIVYILVGIAGIAMMFCGRCSKCMMEGKMMGNGSKM